RRSPARSPPRGSTCTVGTTTVTCTATDASGNTATCSFTVRMNDTQAPTITCPTNTAVGTTSATGSTVAFTTPTVSDNCPGIGSPVCTPASGTNFPVGTTTVTCTVADAAGNTASCSFTVSVVRVTFAVADPLSCTGPGNVVNGSITITNPGVSTAVVASVALPAMLVGLTGSCT